MIKYLHLREKCHECSQKPSSIFLFHLSLSMSVSNSIHYRLTWTWWYIPHSTIYVICCESANFWLFSLFCSESHYGPNFVIFLRAHDAIKRLTGKEKKLTFTRKWITITLSCKLLFNKLPLFGLATKHHK